MLVEFWVHVVEVNLVNVHLVDILRLWVTSGEANVSKLLERNIRLILDASDPVSSIVSTIFQLQGPVNDSVLNVQGSTIKVIHHTRIVSLCYNKVKYKVLFYVLRLLTAYSTVSPGNP